MKKLNLIGEKFNRLLVLSEMPIRNMKTYWKCKCDCGNIITVQGSALTTDQTQSCECLQKERASVASFKHKLTQSTEYYSWTNMKTRCLNPNSQDYADYGGRGIRICETWKDDFLKFLSDMGKKPSKKHSLDRIDVNGNYCPENCRWAIPFVQTRNKRSNRWLEHNGLKMILQDWAEYFGIDQGNLSVSLKRKSITELYNFYYKKYGMLPAPKK